MQVVEAIRMPPRRTLAIGQLHLQLSFGTPDNLYATNKNQKKKNTKIAGEFTCMRCDSPRACLNGPAGGLTERRASRV